MNLIAGASVWFYDASTAGRSDRDSGRRFRETLAAYWPWDDGEIVDRAEGTRLLYECIRNPLAHGSACPAATPRRRTVALGDDEEKPDAAKQKNRREFICEPWRRRG